MTDDDLADEIVGRCRRRLDAGETVDVDAMIRENPGLADRLRERLAALRALDRAFPRAAPAAPAAPSLAGRSLGPYRLLEELGAGGMGAVYAAEVDGRRVAVKVVHPHLLARAGFAERFAREAAIGRSVAHPNVVATIDAGAAELDGRTAHFLVMELVVGRTLRGLLDDIGRAPEELCRHVGREVAKGLAAIHAAGAVHRDLKLENVLITEDHRVRVMDLGVARVLDDAARLSQTGAFVGSLQYAAPEQFRGGAAVDARADLHGLGLLLHELATGAHPFVADEPHAVVRRILDEPPRRIGTENPQVTPFLEELVLHLLEKDRERRPASAEEVARILEEGEESAWWCERERAIRDRTRRPLRRVRVPRETAMYGRNAEMAKLLSLFEQAEAGDGRVVLIEGEAGIGKSRLADEWVALLHQQGHDVNFLYGSYPPGGAATASGAFSRAYREHLGDDEAGIRAALPQTPLLVPAFAALLRGDVAPEDAQKLTKDSLQTVFVHATRSFAAERPTIVLIDDLHFAPEEGRALFASLALAVPGHRVLLVGAARPTLDAAWTAQIERLSHATRLPLARLGAKDLVLLLRDSLRSEHLAEELAAKVAVKSDGNPFFVFEILRGLREGQFLTRRPDGTWATTKVIAEIQVPSSIVDLVQARVSAVDRADRDVLEVASCVGFEFDPALVGDVLGVARIPLLRTLGAIEKSHRLVRSVGRRFAFDHHQVMEVLYAGLSEPLREEYHAAIGDAIERRSDAESKRPEDVDGALCVLLAEHFLKGKRGPRAMRYLERARTKLEQGFAHEQCIDLLRNALAQPGLVEGVPRAKLLLQLGDRLALLDRTTEERACIDEASQLARAAGEKSLEARSCIALGSLYQRTGRNDESVASFHEGIELARAAGDVVVQLSGTGGLLNALGNLGRMADALVVAERDVVLARSVGDRIAEAGFTTSAGVACQMLARFAESRVWLDKALELYRRLGDRPGEGFVIGALGTLFLETGQFDEARSHFEESLAISVEIGERRRQRMRVGSLANLLTDTGRLAESLPMTHRQIELARESSDRQTEAVGLVNLGRRLGSLGDWAGARLNAEKSLAICREIGARRIEGYALLDLADAAAEASDFEGARRLLEESLSLRREISDRYGIADTLVALGALLIERGRVAEGSRLLEEAAEVAAESGLPRVSLLCAVRLAVLPGGDARAATTLFEQQQARLGAWELMEVRYRLFGATGDLAHLESAKSRLDEYVFHSPPEYRGSMVENVRLLREIAAAAREHGIA